MFRFALISMLSLASSAAFSMDWQPIAINKSGTKVFVSPKSIEIGLSDSQEVYYNTMLEQTQHKDYQGNNEILYSSEMINCSTGEKSLFALGKTEKVGKASKTTNPISKNGIPSNSVYLDVMKYVCSERNKRMTESELLTKPVSTAPVVAKNIGFWSYVYDDQALLIQVDDTSFEINSATKRVSYKGKFTSKKDTKALKKDEYYIVDSIMDCANNKNAGLKLTRYSTNDKILLEERTAYENLKFHDSNSNVIVKNIADYVCNKQNFEQLDSSEF